MSARKPGFPGTVRFLASLVLALLVLLGFFAVVGAVGARLPGGIGLGLGIVAGGCLAFATMLAYWSLADWLNLGIIRRTLRDGARPRDGEVVAFDGFVRIEGAPMLAPFSGTPCAAYTYVVSASGSGSNRGGSRRRVLAQGFHMLPTRIEGRAGNATVRSLPDVEDDLRRNERGTVWGRQARALFDTIAEASPAGMATRHARLLEARHAEIDEVHEDYRMSTLGEHVDGLVIDEEALPVDQAVCVIGTYDQEHQALTARRSRFGPNLMVYLGSAQDVLSRVGKDSRWFAKAIVILLIIGLGILGVAFWP